MGWPAVIVNEMYNVKAYLGVSKPVEQPQAVAPVMAVAAPTTLAAANLTPQQGLDVRTSLVAHDVNELFLLGNAKESSGEIDVYHQAETILRRAVLGTGQVELRGRIELVL